MPLLERPFTAFIRLSNPINLAQFTEVPIRTRFIFLYLEPKSSHAPTAAVGVAGPVRGLNADGSDGAANGARASEGAEMSKSETSLSSNENPVVPTTHFREMGRCFATLMSDEIFHIIAYRARDREDLNVGFEEFLNNVTVLPPGEWDPTIRIEPPKSLPSQV